MRVVVSVAPEPVVSWDAAEAHLSLGGDISQKAHVEGLIAAATADIDGPEGWLGRALGVQTLVAYLPAPGCERVLKLSYPPVVSVESIEARTDSGWVLVDEGIYEVRGAEIWRNRSASWPSWIDDPEAVRVTYVAGYQTIPASIRAAILLMVGDLFKFRETATVNGAVSSAIAMSTTVRDLLSPYRMWG